NFAASPWMVAILLRCGNVKIWRKKPLKRYVLKIIMPLLKVHHIAHPLAREIKAQNRSGVQVIEHSQVGRMVHDLRVVLGGGLYLLVSQIKFAHAPFEVGDEL